MVETKACPGDWEHYKNYTQNLSPCKQGILDRNFVKLEYLTFIRYMEEKFSGTNPDDLGGQLDSSNTTAEAEAETDADAEATDPNESDSEPQSYSDFMNNVSTTFETFEVAQCQGFCKVPKHLLFKTDLVPETGAEDEAEEIQPCSEYILKYLVSMVVAFQRRCMWHA